MATVTININGISEGWTGASGAATDIDEAVASADGSEYGGGGNADPATFDLSAHGLSDSDTITNVSITVRVRDAGSAGTRTCDVDFLIGGTPQGTTQNTGALASSHANYGPLNTAGWNSDWTAAQLTGAQVRLTPQQSGMPGTNSCFVDCVDVVITYSPPFSPNVLHWRVYDDDGTESSSTPKAGEDTALNINRADPADMNFHVRFLVEETAGSAGAATDDWQLRRKYNGGAVTDVGRLTSVARMDRGSQLTEGGSTTNRATNGLTDPASGSFVTGVQNDADGLIANFQLTASNFTELVFAGTLLPEDLAATNTVELQLWLDTGSGFAELSKTPAAWPVITATDTPGSYPFVEGRAIYEGLDAASHDVTLPSGIVSGEDLLMVVTWGDGVNGLDNAAVSGFTKLDEQNIAGSVGGAVFYRTADGTEGATATLTGDTTNPLTAVTVRVSGGPGATPDISTAATGTSASPNPGSLTPAGGSDDYLWLELLCIDSGGTPAPLEQRSANYAHVGEALLSADCGSYMGQREATAASEDPGSATAAVSEQWIAWTVAFAPGGGPTEQTLSASFTGTASLALSQPFSRKIFSAASAGTAALTTQRPFSNILLAAQSGFSATVRAIGQFVQTLAASLGGSATIARRLMLVRTFSASAIGTASITATRLAAATLVTLTAAMAGTASLARRLTARRTLSASFTGTAVLRRVVLFFRTLSADLTGTATLRGPGRFLRTFSTSFTGTAAISRRLTAIRKFVAAAAGTASMTAAQLAAVTQITLAAVMSGSAALAHRLTAMRSFSVIASGSATIRQTATFMRSLPADLTGTATIRTLVRYFRTFTASLTGTATLTAALVGRALTQVTLAASMAGTAALNRLLTARRTLATSLTGSAVLRRASLFLRSLSTSTTGTAALSNIAIFMQTLTASLGGTAALTVRAIHSRVLAASMTATATLARLALYFRTLTASVTGSATMTRLMLAFRAFTAAMGVSATLNRLALFRRTLAAAAGMTVSLTRGVAFTLTEITLAASAGLSATISSLLQAVRARFTGGGGMGIGTPGRWGARKGTWSARKSTWRGRK